MAKYIDKYEAMQYIIFEVVDKKITCGELVRGIENISTIDIVYCQNCEYSKVYSLHSDVCPQRWCEKGVPKLVADDDYCRWGKEKTNDE